MSDSMMQANKRLCSRDGTCKNEICPGSDRCNNLCGLLHYYITGIHYDCSFKVGNPNGPQKVFKCHKLIIADVSPVMEQLLLASDSEANLDPYFEIPLENATPEIFNIAMSYSYGRGKSPLTLPSVHIAVETFRFAHEMQMNGLLQVVEDFLKREKNSHNIFEMLDFFNVLEYQAGFDWCWDEINAYDNSRMIEALESESWRNMSVSTIDFVVAQAKDLECCDDVDIFNALIDWGIVQVRKQRGREPINPEVRQKVLKQIRMIRFWNMSAETFAELSLDTDVLTFKEKFHILLSITTGNDEHMPENFSREF